MAPMPVFASVLCAVDLSPLSARVIRHAAGIAGACGARLTIMTVTPADGRKATTDLAAMVAGVVPLGAAYLGDPAVRVIHLAMGAPVDAILDLVKETGADLVVAGTKSRSKWSRWLLGSTSSALLAEAVCPTLLVPPGDVDVVTVGAHAATMHPGTVLAAVDLEERNARQLVLANGLAQLAKAPLVALTVIGPDTDEVASASALRELVKGLGATDIARLRVRRGPVHDAIDAAAVAEQAGLVVMGLRERSRGVPGETASAVLRTKDALVLAVPAL
jgi:nucleotide-binding universal stress UspA family protein